jgi:hypothetical protein
VLRSWRRPVALAFAVACLLGMAAGPVGAGTALPKPGTPSQVSALVSASDRIRTLPAHLVPGLLLSDDPPGYYPATAKGCTGATQCVYGDTASKRVMVLFGDSHALMWLPAIAPVASEDRVKLVVEWMPGCPAATVSVWNTSTRSIDSACNTFRTGAIASITSLDPFLVLIADRTTDVWGQGGTTISNATWKDGEEATISALQSPTTQVAVIGDITIFNFNVVGCMASFEKHLQRCAVPNPNPKVQDHFAAEQGAASAEGVSYLDPQPWLCTSTCSPVIGNMAVYFDDAHVTSTYAEYLTKVWAAALEPLIDP